VGLSSATCFCRPPCSPLCRLPRVSLRCFSTNPPHPSLYSPNVSPLSRSVSVKSRAVSSARAPCAGVQKRLALVQIFSVVGDFGGELGRRRWPIRRALGRQKRGVTAALCARAQARTQYNRRKYPGSGSQVLCLSGGPLTSALLFFKSLYCDGPLFFFYRPSAAVSRGFSAALP
jgi:hypothetical protein